MNRDLSNAVKEAIINWLVRDIQQVPLPPDAVYRGYARVNDATFQINVAVEAGMWKHFEVQVRELR